MLTPGQVQHGHVEEVIAVRNRLLEEAYQLHPERLARPPVPQMPPAAVRINPPTCTHNLLDTDFSPLLVPPPLTRSARSGDGASG